MGGLLSNSRGVGGVCSKGPVEHFLDNYLFQQSISSEFSLDQNAEWG